MLDISNAKFKSPRGYIKPICTYYITLDLETSYNDEHTLAWSYQQGIGLFNSENGKLINYKETRNILDLISLLVTLNNDLENKGFIYIFVHNLSFDITFFRTTLINAILKTNNKAKYSDLLTDNNSWLTFKIANLEFRCSYKLTLMSLYTFTKKMNVKHIKLLGANDYGKYFSDTELTEEFHKYLYNDVVGLGEAIFKLMDIEGLTLRTLPLTSTGFIREELKAAFRKDKDAISDAKTMKPCAHEFQLWNYAFKGGLNRISHKYKGRLLTNKVYKIKHFDFVSHYPSLLLTKKYPSGTSSYYKFEYNSNDDIIKNADWLKNMTYNDNVLIVAEVKLIDYEVSDERFNLFESLTSDYIAVCTPDLKSLYEFAKVKNILPIKVYTYRAARLPKQIIDIIKKYFASKSILKEKIKIAKRNNSSELLELEAEYSRAKAKLNGIGGLLQQKPINDNYSIDEFGNCKQEKFDLNDIDAIENILDKYYGTSGPESKRGEIHKGRCFSFLHGVFMTAYGRYELLRVCNTVGWDNDIYSDTDSLFGFISEEVEKRLTELNNLYRKEAIDNEAYVDIELEGIKKRCYLSWLDEEAETITKLKVIGPKRYAYHSVENGFKIVCSSVAMGSELYEDEHGHANYRFTREMELCGLTEPRELTDEDIAVGFSNFGKKIDGHGFIFKKCASNAVSRLITKPGYYNIEGHNQWVDNGTIIMKQSVEIKCMSNNIFDVTEDYNNNAYSYSEYKEEDEL